MVIVNLICNGDRSLVLNDLRGHANSKWVIVN